MKYLIYCLTVLALSIALVACTPVSNLIDSENTKNTEQEQESNQEVSVEEPTPNPVEDPDNSKQEAILAENERHEGVLKQLRADYDASVYLYQQQLNSLPTPQYSESYYDSQIATLQSEIASLNASIQIASLDKSASGQSKVSKLKQELSSKQSNLNNLIREQSSASRYYEYQNLMKQAEKTYNNGVQRENALHQKNLSGLED